MTIRGHFDGKVVVLDEPAHLDAGTEVEITPKQRPARDTPPGTPPTAFIAAARKVAISSEDLDIMQEGAIEAREQLDPPENHDW
jgi:hypothetical protein